MIEFAVASKLSPRSSALSFATLRWKPYARPWAAAQLRAAAHAAAAAPLPLHPCAAHAAAAKMGQKRDPGEIERLTGRLLDYVKGNAGQRIEQIAAGMGTVTKELNLPVKKLIAQKSLKTKGQKRATQYFAR